MRVLVTGIAGDIGNGVGRILRDSGVATWLLGSDIHGEHGGQLVCDECAVLPRADSPRYTGQLLQLARGRSVDLIVPTSEAELRFFFEAGIDREIDGIPVLMASRKALEVGFDKLATARFLENHDQVFPWTRLVSQDDPLQLPCVVKSRFGAGSKEVRIVAAQDQVPAYRAISPDHIWQEHLGTPDKEYTCGVLRFARTNEIRVIVFRRRLVGGLTGYGEIVADRLIEQLCEVLAQALDLDGSINVQLRMTERGPVVFEINPRFSSTVVFRHLLGFRDVLWSLSMRLNDVLPPYRDPAPAGTRVLRKYGEIVLDWNGS